MLLVDDHRDTRELYARSLAYRGMKVQAAECGDGVLSIALATCPDVIVMDLCMPGVGGDEVIAALKANPKTRRIPIVVLTARGAEAHADALTAGADAFFRKPLLPQKLARLVRQFAQGPPI